MLSKCSVTLLPNFKSNHFFLVFSLRKDVENLARFVMFLHDKSQLV